MKVDVWAASDPDVPVTVTVYVPAGVPPPPPPLVCELLPPHAIMKTKPAITMQIRRIPSSFFRREVKPAPSSVIPLIGSSKA